MDWGEIFYFPACNQLAFLIKCYIHKNYNNRYKNINGCYFLMGETMSNILLCDFKYMYEYTTYLCNRKKWYVLNIICQNKTRVHQGTDASTPNAAFSIFMYNQSMSIPLWKQIEWNCLGMKMPLFHITCFLLLQLSFKYLLITFIYR